MSEDNDENKQKLKKEPIMIKSEMHIWNKR